MNKEDKELLLKDLCARLPYGTLVYAQNADDWYDDEISTQVLSDAINEDYVIKPYLFHLSSMTEEQKKEFLSVAGYERREEDCGRHTETYYYDMVGHENTLYPNCDAIDWLNAHHFDYRGLIEKSLALDATGLNIY